MKLKVNRVKQRLIEKVSILSQNLNDFPNVCRWYMEILDRPATRKGWNVPENEQEIPVP